MGKRQAVIDSPLAGSVPAVEISAGYRRTEVGGIPEDWKLGRLSDFGVFRSGSGFPLIYQGLPSGDYPFFKVSDMNNQGNDLSMEIANHWISEDVRKKLGVTKHPAGSIVFAKIGAAIFLERKRLLSRESCIDNNMMTFSLTDHHACQQYFYYLFLHLELGKYVSTTALPSLSGRPIGAINIPIPPPDEQHAIAEALSDVGALLESLESLIAKKRAIKQATMQQLLTGKTRLPGFSDEWKTKRIGDFTDCIAGGTPSTFISEYWGGAIRWMSSGELNDKIIFDVEGRITDLGLRESNTKIIPPKCTLIGLAGQGKTRGTVAFSKIELCINQSIAAIYPNEFFFPEYLYHNLDARYDKLRGMSTGDGGRGGLNLQIIRAIDLPFPTIDEQCAIATILSDMDAEIAALEQRRDKTRALKQGMMQQLLTGKIRLIESVQTTTRQASAASTGKGHNWQINEAVVISVLAERFGNEEYPLSRMRYTKLLYLLHRHVEGHAEGYLKKAAGPYNPRTRYGGPEKIALKNHYMRRHGNGSYRGFIAGENIEKAEGYFSRWYGEDCLKWLDQFRYERSGDLELLTTVDLAAEELREAGKGISVESVREAIRGEPEWQAKLKRSIFSDANISRAIDKCRTLFDPGHERPKP